MPCTIRYTYAHITPESAREGDAAESGWWDIDLDMESDEPEPKHFDSHWEAARHLEEEGFTVDCTGPRCENPLFVREGSYSWPMDEDMGVTLVYAHVVEGDEALVARCMKAGHVSRLSPRDRAVILAEQGEDESETGGWL